MIVPLLIGGLVGYVVGNGIGQIKGAATAMIPLTVDPNLEQSYRRVIGPMNAEHQKEYDDVMRLAREQREKFARHSFLPFYSEMPLPPGRAAVGAFAPPYWPPYVYGYGMYPVMY